MTKCSLWKASGNNRPTPQPPGEDKGRAQAPLPGPQGPRHLLCHLPSQVGRGWETPIHSPHRHSLRSASRQAQWNTQPGASVRAQRQAQTSSGKPEPQQATMRWDRLTRGREELASMERDGPEELLFHAWGGPGDREQVSTSVS